MQRGRTALRFVLMASGVWMARDRAAEPSRLERFGHGQRWASQPRWPVVVGFAAASGLLAFAGAVIYVRVVDGRLGTGPVAIGVSIGWVLLLTVSFAMSDRRDQPWAWLTYTGGWCLAVLIGYVSWRIAVAWQVTLTVPIWFALSAGIVGVALMFTLPVSLAARQPDAHDTHLDLGEIR